MTKPSLAPASFSKVSVKNQTVIPRAVRQRLHLKAGDTLRYRIAKNGILIDKAPSESDSPFASFSEWDGEADEKAYAEL